MAEASVNFDTGNNGGNGNGANVIVTEYVSSNSAHNPESIQTIIIQHEGIPGRVEQSTHSPWHPVGCVKSFSAATLDRKLLHSGMHIISGNSSPGNRRTMVDKSDMRLNKVKISKISQQGCV